MTGGTDVTRVTGGTDVTRVTGATRVGRLARRLAVAGAFALLVAPGLAVSAIAAPMTAPIAPRPAAAAVAPPSLTIVGDAVYDVLPDQGRVQVRVTLTVKNNLKDTKTKRFFFRVGYVTVVPNTANFKLTAASGSPKVSISSKTDTYTNLKLDFGANLAAGKSTTLTLTYDIKDPGGAPDRPVRISTSLVSFVAWAVAAPGTTGGSVTVSFPIGYDVQVRRGPLNGPTQDGLGHDLWTSGTLAAPLDFVADFSADRPTDYVETKRTVAVADGTAAFTLQAWPDDQAWETRIGSLIERAVPVLERAIGLPWPSEQPLQVHEALVRSTGGYAGIYDPGEHRIDIAYAAPDAVVIHELAHAWFNGGLVADRWIAEGFASHYAELVAKQLGIDPVPIAPPPDETAPPIPLNAWAAASPDATDAETWGYAASLELANAIAARAGERNLRQVWWRAAHVIGGYQPSAGPDEPAAGAPDWRGLLDLLEDVTKRDFVDLWRQSVARPQDLDALADRASARGYYARSLEAAEGWQLPTAIRAAMRAWRFDIARDLLVTADRVRLQRATLEMKASWAGATLPETLRTTFESGAGPDAAVAEASAEEAVLDEINAAREARPSDPGIGEQAIIDIGLLFQDPDARFTEALDAFRAGELQRAFGAARSAEDSWRGAAEAGRSRILSVLLLVLATVLLVSLVRRGLMPAPPGVKVGPKRTSTLAGHPAGAVGDAGSAGDEGGGATKA